jgi:competence protein ComGC
MALTKKIKGYTMSTSNILMLVILSILTIFLLIKLPKA